MAFKSLRFRSFLTIIFLGLLLSNTLTSPPPVVGNTSQKQTETIINRIEKISIDDTGNLLRLTDQEKNANQYPPVISGIFSGIATDGNYAYIVDHVFFHGAENVGLWIVDFFAPGGPMLMGFLNIQLANDIIVRGDYAYIVSGYLGNDYQLSIIDISDPTTPSLVSTKGLAGAGTDIFIDGNYAYVSLSMYESMLQIFEISNPSNPILLGSFAWNGQSAEGVYEHEGIAYLASDFGLYVVDVSHPSLPSLISVLPMVADNATGVKLKNNIAWVTTESLSDQGALYAIDTSDPTNPFLLSNYAMPEADAQGIWILGNFGFIANDNYGLRIMDLSDPSAPETIGIITTEGRALDLTSDGTNLYLAAYDSVYLFELNLFSVKGSVVDTSGSPMNNFLVAAGNASDTFTEITGSYVLEGLEPGSYQVQAYQNGYHTHSYTRHAQVPPSTIVPDIIVDENDIQGHVQAANLQPVPDVILSASDGISVDTGPFGEYKFGKLLEQPYTLVPTLESWVFQPDSIAFTVPAYHHYQGFWLLPAPQSFQLNPGVPAQVAYTEYQETNTIIQFPPNAVTSTTDLILTPTIIYGYWGNLYTGHSFDLSVLSTDRNIPAFSFNAPITVTIEYSNYDLRGIADETLLNMQVKDGDSWMEASSTCDPPQPYIYAPDINMVTLTICKSGIYALFGPSFNVLLPSIFNSP